MSLWLGHSCDQKGASRKTNISTTKFVHMAQTRNRMATWLGTHDLIHGCTANSVRFAEEEFSSQWNTRNQNQPRCTCILHSKVTTNRGIDPPSSFKALTRLYHPTFIIRIMLRSALSTYLSNKHDRLFVSLSGNNGMKMRRRRDLSDCISLTFRQRVWLRRKKVLVPPRRLMSEL